MHTLIRSVPLRHLVLQAAPPGAAALVVAERFYHWHSFTLECAGFLATWYALDLGASAARRLLSGSRT